MEMYQIRLQIFKTANDDGSDAATISKEAIVSRVTRANEIYQSAGVKFLFQPSADLVILNNTLLNQDFTLFDEPAKYTSDKMPPPHDAEAHWRARAQLANVYPSRFTIFFTHRTKLEYTAGHWTVVSRGGSSSWFDTNLHMPGNGGHINLLAHEMGHYLQIRHTFRSTPNNIANAATLIKKYVEAEGHPKSDGLDVLDGDRVWVMDTPSDASGDIFVTEGLSVCGGIGQITIPVQFSDGTSKDYVLSPDRSNIMSYFFGCSGAKTLSVQQRRRVRDGFEIGLRQRLIANGVGELTGKVERRGSAQAGVISRLDAAPIQDGRVATAVRDEQGKLRVIVWDVNSTGLSITQRGTGQAGVVGDVAICSLGLGLLATVVRDSQSNLKVIIWRVNSAGDVERLESASAGKVSRIVACRLGIEHLATAVLDAAGKVKVSVWHVTAAGQIVPIAGASAGVATELAISSVQHDTVVTHVRDGAGNLSLITWQFDEKNKNLVRRGTARTGSASVVAGVSLDWHLPVSAVRGDGDDLKVITWQVSDDDRDIVQRAHGVAGKISDVAVCGMGPHHLVTVVKDSGNNLKVILWQVGSGGYHIERLGDAGAGGVGRITACRTGRDLLVTAVETREHKMKLIAWRIS